MNGNGYTKATDYAALAIAVVVAVSTWALFVYEYLTNGPPPMWLTTFAVLSAALALLTLFGRERITEAMGLLRP